MERQEQIRKAEAFYEKLRSLYKNPIPDKVDGQAQERYANQVRYYLKQVSRLDECIKALETYNNDQYAAIFILIAAMEAGYSERNIRDQFQILISTLRSTYRPRLGELVRGRFWEMDLGDYKLRPYKENQT